MEIDAFDWRDPYGSQHAVDQVCTETEQKATRFEPDFGSCFTPGAGSQSIYIECSLSITDPKPLRDTEVGGSLAPDVARVVVSVKRLGHEKKIEHVRATVAQVSGDLQRELHQSKPFGYFYAKVPGVVRPSRHDLRATAFDARGRKLSSTAWKSS